MWGNASWNAWLDICMLVYLAINGQVYAWRISFQTRPDQTRLDIIKYTFSIFERFASLVKKQRRRTEDTQIANILHQIRAIFCRTSVFLCGRNKYFHSIWYRMLSAREPNYRNFTIRANKSVANMRRSDLCHLILHCRYYIISLNIRKKKIHMLKQCTKIIFARILLSNANHMLQSMQSVPIHSIASTRHVAERINAQCTFCSVDHRNKGK